VASLVLSLVWVFGLGSLAAVVMGHVAMSRIKRDPLQSGQGLAIAGLVLGYLGSVGLLLIAIAIPTFMGAQDRARDRAAQSDLRNGLTGALSLASDYQGRFLSPGGGPLSEESLEEASGLDIGTAGEGIVEFQVFDHAGPSSGILLWTQSASGTWFGVRGASGEESNFCSGHYDDVSQPADCFYESW